MERGLLSLTLLAQGPGGQEQPLGSAGSDTHFPPVLGQDFAPKSRTSHLCLIHSILAHWPPALGPRPSRWFEASSIVPSICSVSWPQGICEHDDLAFLSCMCYQEAMECSVRNMGLVSPDTRSNPSSSSCCVTFGATFSPRPSVSHLGNADNNTFSEGGH